MLLTAVRQGSCGLLVQVAEPAAKAAEKAKGSYGAGHGEELLMWLPIIWGIRSYADSLAADARPKPNSLRTRRDGQTVVEVFPKGCALPHGFA